MVAEFERPVVSLLCPALNSQHAAKTKARSGVVRFWDARLEAILGVCGLGTLGQECIGLFEDASPDDVLCSIGTSTAERLQSVFH